MDSQKLDLYRVHLAYPLAFAALGLLLAVGIMLNAVTADAKPQAEVNESTSIAYIF